MSVVAEPPVQTDFGMPARGQSEIFKAVAQKNNEQTRQASEPVSQPTVPKEPVAPVEKVDPVAPVVPEVKSTNPLEELTKAPVKVEPTGHEKDLEDFDKTLPEAYEGMQSQAKKGWEALRSSAKNAKREALEAKRAQEEYKQKLEELQKAPPATQHAPDEVERIKQENEFFKKKNAVWALERDPKFQEAVLSPLDKAGQALGSLMESYKINAGELDKAFSLADRTARNKAFSEIITDKEMNPLDIKDFQDAVTTVMDLSFKRDEAYGNAQKMNEAAEALAKQDREKKQQMSKQEIEGEESKMWDRISKNAPVVKDILGNSATATEVRSLVKSYLSGDQPPEMKVYAAYASYLLPKMKDLVESKDTEIASLKQALKDKVDGDATVGTHRAAAPAADNKQLDTKPGSAIGAAVSQWKNKFGN